MTSQEEIFKKLIAHCKEYGFVFASSEIYDGLAAVYDYGQNGVELKNNIKAYWWEAMTRLNDNVVGIDAAIFMHPTTWKASGHVDAFNDPLIDNRDSKKRYRADVLIEDVLVKFDEKIAKEVDKAAKRFGESFDRDLYCRTNPRVVEYSQKRDTLHERFATAMNDNNLDELKQIIVDYDVVCPVSGTKNWTDVRQFNLMFSTEIGSVADGATKVYLRPETAQGIFVNFLNVQKTGRMKIPFGIAQIAIFCPPGRGDEVVRLLETFPYALAPVARTWRRQISLPRPRKAGTLRQCRYRYRVRDALWIQRGGGDTQPHGLRPVAAREIFG